MPAPQPSDEALLVSGRPEDFGRFYDRYVRSLLAYFQRRTRDPEIAADWGVSDPILSARDQANPLRKDLEPMWQPHYSLRT